MTLEERIERLEWKVPTLEWKVRSLEEHRPAAQVWHDGSELPENPDKDTIYLAIGINGKPFLTHFWTEGIWKKSVIKWQYIDIPTDTPS